VGRNCDAIPSINDDDNENHLSQFLPINAVAHLRRAVDWQGDTMMEAAVAELYRNGTIGRHIKKVLKLYRERRDYFCSLLEQELASEVLFKVPDGGMSVWVKFNRDLKRISGNASKQGLTMTDVGLHNSFRNYNSTRIRFASLNLVEQEKAVGILAGVCESK